MGLRVGFRGQGFKGLGVLGVRGLRGLGNKRVLGFVGLKGFKVGDEGHKVVKSLGFRG